MQFTDVPTEEELREQHALLEIQYWLPHGRSVWQYLCRCDTDASVGPWMPTEEDARASHTVHVAHVLEDAEDTRRAGIIALVDAHWGGLHGLRVHVAALREKGWRSSDSTCEECGGWGPYHNIRCLANLEHVIDEFDQRMKDGTARLDPRWVKHQMENWPVPDRVHPPNAWSNTPCEKCGYKPPCQCPGNPTGTGTGIDPDTFGASHPQHPDPA